MVERSNAWNESSAVDTQVENLLQRLTLEEKIDLVSGKLAVDNFRNVPALPDGFPVLALADGPAGLRLANPMLPDHRATALPAPIALAATWDPDLARRYGDVLGTECGQPVKREKFCTECGTKVEGSPKFCPECGARM